MQRDDSSQHVSSRRRFQTDLEKVLQVLKKSLLYCVLACSLTQLQARRQDRPVLDMDSAARKADMPNMCSDTMTTLMSAADPQYNAKLAGGIVGGIIGFLAVLAAVMAVLAGVTFRTRARKRHLQHSVYNLVMGIRPDDFHPTEFVQADMDFQVKGTWLQAHCRGRLRHSCQLLDRRWTWQDMPLCASTYAASFALPFSP